MGINFILQNVWRSGATLKDTHREKDKFYLMDNLPITFLLGFPFFVEKGAIFDLTKPTVVLTKTENKSEINLISTSSESFSAFYSFSSNLQPSSDILKYYISFVLLRRTSTSLTWKLTPSFKIYYKNLLQYLTCRILRLLTFQRLTLNWNKNSKTKCFIAQNPFDLWPIKR